MKRGFALAVCAAAALVLLPATTSARRESAATLEQLVGQHVLVRMHGSSPSATFLARIRRGQIGGVVLFGENISHGSVRPLVERLRAAARAGGQLPLLIATDQEGGGVKRFPGPPTEAPSAMRSAADAYVQGRATGSYLRSLDVDFDLAPVLDVPATPRAFIASRTFSASPALVASRGVAFARGLVSGGVGATAKHFPGLGRLTQSTDYGRSATNASRSALERDLEPFRAAIRSRVPAIMVGTASYPAYGDGLPAACSPNIVGDLLRQDLGYTGVVLSDDLATAGVSWRFKAPEAAVRATEAGVDMVYVAGPGGSGGVAVGEATYSALLNAARGGELTRAQLQASYDRIASLKRAYAG